MWPALQSQRTSHNQHRGCCCMSLPPPGTCSSETYQGSGTACAHTDAAEVTLYTEQLRGAWQGLVPLSQRPPKCISYQKHDFKAEEKTESKHLKAQMEAEKYTQSSRKCHFTIHGVCEGDDINTHSRISLPVLLRSR